jgi:hypothetical protein
MANEMRFSEDLRRRAEQNDPLAQWDLGWCYYDGEGVKKNKRDGIMWLRKAAQRYPSDDPILQQRFQTCKDVVKAKLVIMVVGGIIGCVLGAIIGASSGVASAQQGEAGLAGFLLGGYFGLGIGHFTTGVILSPKVVWDGFWNEYRKTSEFGSSLFWITVGSLFGLVLFFFFSPFAAVYRVVSSARLNGQIFGQR